MNDQSNPVGIDQTEIAAKENGRRRLVRGAVSFAPVVLTLRSGGVLAAASCTGVSQVVMLDNQGQFAPSGGAQVNDVCVTQIQINGCPAGKIDSGTKSGVSVTETGIPPKTLQCQGLQNQQVAILSATAAGSLFPPGS